MPHDRRIGSEPDAPEQSAAQQGHALPAEIRGQLLPAFKDPVPGRADIGCSGGNRNAQRQFNHPGQRCRQRRAPGVHGRRPEQSENKHGVQNDVADHRRRGDPGSGHGMVRHLHHQQVALGNPGNQIGPAGNPQVGAAGLNNRIVMGKQPHQLLRAAFTGGKEDQGDDAAPAQHDMKDAPDRVPVPLSPVLGAENGPGGNRRKDEHVLHKLNLGGQGNRGHLILGHAAQHQGVRRGHGRQHQALECDGRCQRPQLQVKGTVVDLHEFLRANRTLPRNRLQTIIRKGPCFVNGLCSLFFPFQLRYNIHIDSIRTEEMP